ncbi:MlaD family protein [Baekduia sp. Peel2402]|uniref:MlaD family protein n=1 Tax=Baekduia sp. Peel2402 TaxID=3458296 RepID=UPI00403EEA1D
MITERLGFGRILVVVAFTLTCFGLMLYLWSAFGGSVPLKPHGYRVRIALPEADLLAVQADVRVSGVSIGHVVETERSPVDGNRLDAVVEVDARYAPLRGDVQATIRRKSLAGEEYLELTPGTRDTVAIADGGRLPSAQIAPSVEIDELLRAFDAPTRRALEVWIQSQAAALDGRGGELNAALGQLPGFEEGLTGLLEALNRQAPAVRAAVSGTGELFDALSERRAALRGAIVNGSRATDALAARADSIAAAFRALPEFEAQSRALLARVDRFRVDADPVLTALRPGIRELSATAGEIRKTAPELASLAHGALALSAASRRGLPATQRFLDRARPLVAQFAPFLDQLAPVLGYIGPRADAVSTLVANLTAATQATASAFGTEEPLHYARGGMLTGPGMLAQYASRQSWMRSNAYASEPAGTELQKSVFDVRGCSDAPAFPTIARTPELDQLWSPTMVARIEKYVLNGGVGAAPPCRLQKTPQGETAFPRVEPLSHSPSAGGAGP